MKIAHHVGLRLNGGGYMKVLGVLNVSYSYIIVLNICFDKYDLGVKIKKVDLWMMRTIKDDDMSMLTNATATENWI